MKANLILIFYRSRFFDLIFFILYHKLLKSGWRITLHNYRSYFFLTPNFLVHSINSYLCIYEVFECKTPLPKNGPACLVSAGELRARGER